MRIIKFVFRTKMHAPVHAPKKKKKPVNHLSIGFSTYLMVPGTGLPYLLSVTPIVTHISQYICILQIT